MDSSDNREVDQAMTNLFPPPLAEQIRCVEREIAIREHVYPWRVEAKRMTQSKADTELAAMRAALETLKGIKS